MTDIEYHELVHRATDAAWKALRAAQDDAPMGGAYVDPEMEMIDASGAGISLQPAVVAVLQEAGIAHP